MHGTLLWNEQEGRKGPEKKAKWFRGTIHSAVFQGLVLFGFCKTGYKHLNCNYMGFRHQNYAENPCLAVWASERGS